MKPDAILVWTPPVRRSLLACVALTRSVVESAHIQAAQQMQLATDRHDRRAIHAKSHDRRASHRTASLNSIVGGHREIPPPLILARMMKRNIFTIGWVLRSHARRLAERTRNACKSQVIGRRRAAQNARNDVVNVECRFLGRLRNPAVLAGITGPLANLTDQMSRDMATHERDCPETRSALSLSSASMSTKSVKASAS